MEKIPLVVIAVAVMLASGPLSAADQEKAKQKEDPKSVGNSSDQEAAYLAAVKRCEGSEAKEKQRCVESAKERYGEMLR